MATISTSPTLKVVKVNLGDMMATLEANLKAHTTQHLNGHTAQIFNSTKMLIAAQEKRLATVVKEEIARATGELRSNIVGANKEMMKTWKNYLDMTDAVKQMSEMSNNNNTISYNQGKSTMVSDLSAFKKHVDAILNTVQCQGCGGSVAFSQASSMSKKRGRKARSTSQQKSTSPKSSTKSPRSSPKSMPLIDQEMGLTNDLRDIMREANILDEMEAEKMEQENLEALESIDGSAGEVFEPGNLEALKIMEGSGSENSRRKAADVDVDVESVWTPHQLIQDLNACQKWRRSPNPTPRKRHSRTSYSSSPVLSVGFQAPSGSSGESKAYAPHCSISPPPASFRPVTPGTFKPSQTTASRSLQLVNSSFQGDLGDLRSRPRSSDSFSSWSSKSPLTPRTLSRPPPTPGKDCSNPSICPIGPSTIKATSAQIEKLNQINDGVPFLKESKTTSSASGGQQLNMEMVRMGGITKQALPRELSAAAVLDLPDYTSSSPGPGEHTFHTSTSHLVNRCSVCGEDLLSAAALERHMVCAHSESKK